MAKKKKKVELSKMAMLETKDGAIPVEFINLKRTNKRSNPPTWVRLKASKQQVRNLQKEIDQLHSEHFTALQNVELYETAYKTALDGIRVRDERIDRLIGMLDGYISEIVDLRRRIVALNAD